MDKFDTGKILTNEEQGIALELANLISGAASSTLAMLLDQDLELGKPEILEIRSFDELKNSGIPPKSVMAVLNYIGGFKAPVCYIINLQAAGAIADIMMGGMPSSEIEEISDIQLSAVGEAISQMMGAAANNISHFLSQQVEISAPDVAMFSMDNLMKMIPESVSDGLIMVKYKLTGSQVIPDCELLQIMPTQSMREQIHYVRDVNPANMPGMLEETEPAEVFETAMNALDSAAGMSQQETDPAYAGVGASSQRTVEKMTIQEPEYGSFGPAGGGAAQQGGVRQTPANPVTVQPVEFPSFDSHIPASGSINKNLELVMDVCLNLTVELGRTELSIKEVLELTRGSVIELNRVAGEPVDLFANGKMIAKGEVVVIEDNFGLRITSIVSPADRIRGL
jgi:flagellar motor switch protein FliN